MLVMTFFGWIYLADHIIQQTHRYSQSKETALPQRLVLNVFERFILDRLAPGYLIIYEFKGLVSSFFTIKKHHRDRQRRAQGNS